MSSLATTIPYNSLAVFVLGFFAPELVQKVIPYSPFGSLILRFLAGSFDTALAPLDKFLGLLLDLSCAFELHNTINLLDTYNSSINHQENDTFQKAKAITFFGKGKDVVPCVERALYWTIVLDFFILIGANPSRIFRQWNRRRRTTIYIYHTAYEEARADARILPVLLAIVFDAILVAPCRAVCDVMTGESTVETTSSNGENKKDADKRDWVVVLLEFLQSRAAMVMRVGALAIAFANVSYLDGNLSKVANRYEEQFTPWSSSILPWRFPKYCPWWFLWPAGIACGVITYCEFRYSLGNKTDEVALSECK